MNTGKPFGRLSMKKLRFKFVTIILIIAFLTAGGYFISERIKRMESEIARLSQSLEQKDVKLKTLTDRAQVSQKDLEVIKKDLDNTKEELESTKKALDSVNKELSIANTELSIANNELKIADKVLDIASKVLETANKQLDATNKELDIVNKKINELTSTSESPK